MTIGLGSNLAALRAMRELGDTRNSLAQIFERLSSGQRINRAADDAAGLAISEALRKDSRIASKGIQNVNDAISLFNIADGAVANLTDIVTRQLELAQQSANGVFTSEQRGALNTELQALYNEYNRILDVTRFNGLNILNVDFGRMRIQAGGSSVDLNVLAQQQVSVGELILTGYQTTDVNNHSDALNVLAEDRLMVTDYNGDGFDDLVTIGLIETGKGNFLSIKIYSGSADGLTLTGEQTINVGAGKVTGYSFFNSEIHQDSTIRLFLQTNNGTDVEGTLSIAPDGSLSPFTSSLVSIFMGGNQAQVGSITGDFNGDSFSDTVYTANFVQDPPVASGFLRFRLSQTTVSDEDKEILVSLERNSTNILTESSALSALTTLKEDLAKLSRTRAALGASMARSEVMRSLLESKRVEIEAANERILSADVAEESSRLTLAQIREQAAAAVLAQANIQPELALRLLS